MTILSFTKNTGLQNILFDEYFSQYCNITIIALNYDGNGTALCSCDGELQQIDITSIKKFIFGVPLKTLENYLQSIFDPNFEAKEINSENGLIKFRMEELNKLKKYDIDNLAKKTLKELHSFEGDHFSYFEETSGALAVQGSCATTKEVYGNTKSLVFHKTNCKSFNAITCTSLFTSHSEALNSGYKPCKMCNP